MTNHVDRRKFLAGSVAAATCVGSQVVASPSIANASASSATDLEYYELRRYRVGSDAARDELSNYLKTALLPALQRAVLDRIGVFTVAAAEDFSLHVLIPFPTIDRFASLRDELAADKTYQAAAQKHFANPSTKPAYQRIESRLMSAFRGMPKLELPAATESGQRMFELRTYESHNEDAARRKVEMFDSGEIQLMRDVKLGPVFFGSTMIGHDVPNLTYMLSAENRKAHDEHWQAFLTHPTWTRMKALPMYKDTVSKITKTYLVPTDYSAI